MRLFVNPHTGFLMDYDSIPDYNSALGLPGKFCPITHKPLDETAVKNHRVDVHDSGLRGEVTKELLNVAAGVLKSANEDNSVTLGVKKVAPETDKV